MEEIWVDIKGYEGLYQVSNLGRVKSKAGLHSLKVISCLGNEFSRIPVKKDQIMKPSHDGGGYLKIGLRIRFQKQRTYTMHRLVATHFIDNPNNYSQINHINAIKTDNRVENLEWVTPSMNKTHSYTLKNIPKNAKHKDKVKEIRFLFNVMKMNPRNIGKVLNIPASSVYWIATYRTWKHIE